MSSLTCLNGRWCTHRLTSRSISVTIGECDRLDPHRWVTTIPDRVFFKSPGHPDEPSGSASQWPPTFRVRPDDTGSARHPH